MKKLLLSLALVLTAGTPFAHAQFFGAGVEINKVLYANDNNGTTRLLPLNSTATLNQTAFTTSPETNATFNLGTFTQGTVLTLNGFSTLTFGGTVTATTANYRIFPGTTPTGAFTPVTLALNEANVSGNTGDSRFSTEALNTNLLAGLTPGTYTLGIYYNDNNATTDYDSNNGANYGATFTVSNAVPEPGTWALLLTGGAVGLFAVQRRRLAAR